MFFQQFKRSYEGIKRSRRAARDGATASVSVGGGAGASYEGMTATPGRAATAGSRERAGPEAATVAVDDAVQLSGLESFLLGAVAAAGSVAVMNPMDTIKTRLVTQVSQQWPVNSER